MLTRVGVPVYLPDRTEAGTATITVEGASAHITIAVDSDHPLFCLFKEQLVGISIVYMNRDAAEAIVNEKTKDLE